MGGREICLSLALSASVLFAQTAQAQLKARGRVMRGAAERLFVLTNMERAKAGVGQLKWDPALAQAAREHCLLMAYEGPIAHQYPGEPGLTARAAQAGAHFSLIEENVAVGISAREINQEWMNSPPHRANLLSPKIDRMGAAVVEARGVLYAVEDFSTDVPQLLPSQVEAQVANMIRVSGVKILHYRAATAAAHKACVTDQGMPPAASGLEPLFLMRWQTSSLNVLPEALTQRLASGRYRSAAVGSCAPQGPQNSFSAYRVAVLLY
jgi:hypothetical protein